MNRLSEAVLSKKLLPHHNPPTQHNSMEYFGVEYLYRQAGMELLVTEGSTSQENSTPEEDVDGLDEGYVDESLQAPSTSEHLMTISVEAPQEEGDEENEDEDDETGELDE